MAGMVIVNNPGDWGNVYRPLLHAEWHGLTPTDLIFPFFLFIVGVSITLSQKSSSWGSILRRSAIIFALGLFLNGYPRFSVSTWRIPGVLQRIAICYLFAAAVYKTFGASGFSRASPSSEKPHSTRSDKSLRSDAGLTPGAPNVLWGISFVLIIGYWLVMALVPAPGGVAGDLSPDGNLGAWIDRALMSGHLWRPRWDPEGLLSTIPAMATTLVGVVAGVWIQSTAPPERKAGVLAACGVAGMLMGLAWHPLFPINKSLWTSSYVVFTAGAAAVLLALCYWTIDLKGWRFGTGPFVVLGTNAIALFVASALLVETLGLIRVANEAGQSISISRYAYQHWFVPLASPKNASLLYAFANLVVLYALLAWMYRRRIFLRV
jgi:predicted acyltransferase